MVEYRGFIGGNHALTLTATSTELFLTRLCSTFYYEALAQSLS